MFKRILAGITGLFTALGAVLMRAVVEPLARIFVGPPIIWASTSDHAFIYRMPAGFPGDINRTHPFESMPGMINTTNPPAQYGGPVFVASDGISIRGVIAGDGSTTPLAVYGFAVRPYPVQQQSGGLSASVGSATPPTAGAMDILTKGYMMSKVPAGTGGSLKKGDQVFARAAATSGAIIQGLLAAAADSTNTISITNARFNGPADAQGNVEIEVWPLR